MRLTIKYDSGRYLLLKDEVFVVGISRELVDDLQKDPNFDIAEFRHALRYEVADETLNEEVEEILNQLKIVDILRESMTINEYQEKAVATAIYGDGQTIVYPTLGLTGEAGEVADKVKKVLRDNNGEFTPEAKLEIAKEIGDVCWYIAALCRDLGFSMTEVCQMNIDKLASRQKRNVISGSGDNR